MFNEHISASNFNLRHVYNNYEWFSFLNINGYPLIVIFWNLFLLIIPYFLVVVLAKYFKLTKFRKIHQKIIAAAVGFLWLLFIPNSAYIINEIRHINSACFLSSPYRVCADSAWMAIFFFTYAALGWIALVYLLNQMKNFIKILYNKKAAKIFIIAIIPLISLGVLLGLINRWNSWEFFIYPMEFFKHALIYFTDCVYFNNWLIFTLFLYILYYAGNYLFKEKLK